jgi:hypothetical protein
MSLQRTHDVVTDENTGVPHLLRAAGPRPAPGAQARARARAAAHGVWRETVAGRMRRRRVILALPMVVAAAVILALVLRPAARPPIPAAGPEVARIIRGDVLVADAAAGERHATSGRILTAGTTVRTGPDAVAALALEGGGELRVNRGTSVRLADLRRLVLDHGHVYLDSGGAALAVETSAGVIRNVGTRFDVRIEHGELRVRVRDGAVRLDAGASRADAGAGQQLLVRPGSPPAVTSVTTYGSEWEWLLRAAPFRAEGARLEAFLQWVESEGGWRVQFADVSLRQALAGTVLHGSIEDLTVREALDVVLPACGLRYRVERDRIVIDGDGGRR